MRVFGQLPLYLLTLIFFTSCSGPTPTPDLAPGYRPSPDSDEAGLWMLADRNEVLTRESGRQVKDSGLQDLAQDIVCQLAPRYCRSVRVTVVELPDINASMSPNGWMQIWTGLLLRTQNEAQLASVLGHELAHFIRRHTLLRWQDLRVRTDQGMMLGLLGTRGFTAASAVIAGNSAFSREQEEEADELGLTFMGNAGYPLTEAVSIFEAIAAEQNASDPTARPPFSLTHPPTELRIERMRTTIASQQTPVSRLDRPDRLAKLVAPHRAQWLRDEFTRRDYGRLHVLLDRLSTDNHDPAELLYFRGELYRLKDAPGDRPRAIEAYRQALALPGAPPEAARALGMLSIKEGNKPLARESLLRYLAERPNASDRAMIESYLQTLE